MIASWLFVASCGHAPTPLPVRVQETTTKHLLEQPTAVIGNLRHVRAGALCTDDDAYALPVVPFRDGPTEVQDWYEGGGVTCTINMFDANESIVKVVRTRLEPGETELDAMQDAERDARSMASADSTALSTEYVIENGKKQLQLLNRSSSYEGKQDESALNLGQGISFGVFDTCRVDRTFAQQGYLFQVVAVARKVVPKEQACAVAVEWVAWTVMHLRVGQGCGPRMTLADLPPG